MKKVYVLAAILMATTAANAGERISIEIKGKRINIEMPSGCSSLSCLKFSSAGDVDDTKRADDDEAAGPNGRRFDDDDDRNSGPGRPGFKGGRRFNDDDRFAGRPGRPDFKGGRRFNDDEEFAGRRGRPDFKGGRRFNDEEEFADRRGRPDFKGDRRFNDEREFAERRERPDFKGGRRFDDDSYRQDERGRAGSKEANADRFNDDEPGRPRFKGGFKSKRYNNSDDSASGPERTPASVAVPAAPAPATAPTSAPVQADATSRPPVRAQVASAPPATSAPAAVAKESDPNSPLGIWASEDNKGNVRIEQCGDDLCGYSEKTGEKVLINMRPDGAKWVGRISDPESGRKYDSTISMRGTMSLRVQGCAFGGMFCGGQTWKRVS